LISPKLYQFFRFASAALVGMNVPLLILVPITSGMVSLAVASVLLTAWVWFWLRPSFLLRLDFTPN